MVTLQDSRITESSGLAFSVLTTDKAYTLNDENGPFFAITPSTGATVEPITIPNAKLKDPEAVAVDMQARIWVGDIGDNEANRSTIAVYMAGEADLGNWSKFVLKYPDGPHNAETLLALQTVEQTLIVTKEGAGKVYRLPANLVAGGQVNMLEHVADGLPAYISDGDYTPDGRFIAFLRKDERASIFMHDAKTFEYLETIPMDEMTKPEGVAVSRDQMSLLVSSEGKHAPLQTVALPERFQPLPPAVPAASPCGGDSAAPSPAPDPASPDPIALANWKLTLPVDTGHAGDPDEILQPELQTFSDEYFTPSGGVVPLKFKAHCGGDTTSGSDYPRSELREMNGGDPAAWSNRSGNHVMSGDLAITHLPVVKPHVVAAQVHDAEDDVIMIRLEGTHLFVEGDGDNLGTLDNNYQLGTRFTYRITASGGKFVVAYNGVDKVTVTAAKNGLYFKAGCYTQSNTTHDAADAYGEVVYYALTVAHS